MTALVRAAAVLLYAQAGFLFLVSVVMVGIVLEPPAGGTRAIASTAFTFAYATMLCAVAFRLARGRRHARLAALASQALLISAALYLASVGRWFGWVSAAYCLVLILLLSLRVGSAD
ncbi:hypothetical protein [Allorhizocola rhizosphaerae]|uniref:hypothetical protein n=1 Tax=Allorhizocola rhizosphaerae TaxID=1872709 RepID=UPI0013C37175|nr:hypothetical protein [Allorhizocola rhizosphaerae]